MYLLLDLSASTYGIADELNNAVHSLVDELQTSPLLGSYTWMAILSFSDDARVEMPLTRAMEIDALPSLSPRGATSYAAAFNLAASVVGNDLNNLKSEGYKVVRPAVFFMTDGQPTDPENIWRVALSGLKTLPVQIFSIGFGSDVDPRQLSQIASDPHRAFLASIGPEQQGHVRVLPDLVSAVLHSTTSSVTAGSRTGTVQIPSSAVPIVISGDDIADDWL
jgi:uncharacterized protein YegL